MGHTGFLDLGLEISGLRRGHSVHCLSISIFREEGAEGRGKEEGAFLLQGGGGSQEG